MIEPLLSRDKGGFFLVIATYRNLSQTITNYCELSQGEAFP